MLSTKVQDWPPGACFMCEQVKVVPCLCLAIGLLWPSTVDSPRCRRWVEFTGDTISTCIVLLRVKAQHISERTEQSEGSVELACRPDTYFSQIDCNFKNLYNGHTLACYSTVPDRLLSADMSLTLTLDFLVTCEEEPLFFRLTESDLRLTTEMLLQ